MRDELLAFNIKIEQIFFALSSSVFTGILTLDERGNTFLKLLSIIVVFVVQFCFIRLVNYNFSITDKTIPEVVSSLFFSYLTIDSIRSRFYSDWYYYSSKYFSMSDEIIKFIFYILLFLSLFVIFNYFLWFYSFLFLLKKEIFSCLSKEEMIFSISFFIILLYYIVRIHFSSSAFGYSMYINDYGEVITVPFDAILDCDSHAVQWVMGRFEFDFRHPFFSFAALPEYIISIFLSNFFPGGQDAARMFILSIFQMTKMTLCGIILNRLTKNKLSMLIWFTSFPVILYSIVIERHTWMTFWILIIVYMACNKRISYKYFDQAYMSIMYAGGANLIGVLITPVIVKYKNIGEWIKKNILLALVFIYIIIFTGGLGGLLNVNQGVSESFKFVNNSDLISNLKEYTVAVKSCFGGIKVIYSGYNTYYNENGFSLFGLVVIIVSLGSSVLALKKDQYSNICAYWIILSIALFPIIGFSKGSFSMHMILFSWAFISLIVMLIGKIQHQVSKRTNIIISAIIYSIMLWQLATNVSILNDLISFAARFNYI